LEWLDGKLPMPKVNDIFVSNLCDLLETEMVHSFFYYAKSGGSQFIVDRLSLGLDISLNSKIQAIELKPEGVLVDGIFYDKVIYTGDVRDLGDLLVGLTPDIDKLLCQTKKFPSNSTTNVLCESLEPIDFSWLYFPESKYSFHRVINTGSFSVNNSPVGMVGSCVVEFSGVFEEAFVLQELEKLPFKVRPIATNIEQASYVIHDNFVSEVVGELKCALEANNFHLLGRFAEWQYYNMDKAMEAAFELAGKFPHASN
jgi:protoporphyrinogen oxidase